MSPAGGFFTTEPPGKVRMNPGFGSERADMVRMNPGFGSERTDITAQVEMEQ